MTETFDVAVIGGGKAGQAAAHNRSRIAQPGSRLGTTSHLSARPR